MKFKKVNCFKQKLPRVIWVLSYLSLSFIFCRDVFAQAEKRYQLFSPDQKTEVAIRVHDSISFSVRHTGQELLSVSQVMLALDQNRLLGASPIVKDVKSRSVNAEIKPVVPEKRKLIPDVYNELELTFSGNYGLRFRAYDDGIAYRFFTNLSGNLIVKTEEVCLNFSAGDSIFFPEEESFMSHSERLYKYLAVKDIADSQMCSLPALVVKPTGVKLAISEADLLDYPGLYLRGSGDGTAALKGKFPPYPLEERLQRDRDLVVTKTADYIAQTTGRRDFPWTPRDFDLDLSFLDAGRYHMSEWADGINADRYASDYKKQTRSIMKNDTLKIHLAPGGGWAAILVP
jgi:alpha-glucosidase